MRSSLILVIKTGGVGGFLTSVRDIGVMQQQQQACIDSAEDVVRGGAGGGWRSRGGGTKPLSPVPSVASTVPVHKVAAKAAVQVLVTDLSIAGILHGDLRSIQTIALHTRGCKLIKGFFGCP